MSRAKTAEEVREDFLDHVRSLARYWANVADIPRQEACEGVAFSILTAIDGSTMALPAMDLVLRPHPADEQYHKDMGENWDQDGLVINDCMLHELFYRKEDKQ